MIPKGAANPSAAGLLIDFMLSDAGRAALASKQLLFPFDASWRRAACPRTTPRSTGRSRSRPTLLLGLDSQKRASFLARWRATFSRP